MNYCEHFYIATVEYKGSSICTMNYPKKNRFQSVPIAALCLYNIQRENLVFKKFSLFLTIHNLKIINHVSIFFVPEPQRYFILKYCN